MFVRIFFVSFTHLICISAKGVLFIVAFQITSFIILCTAILHKYRLYHLVSMIEMITAVYMYIFVYFVISDKVLKTVKYNKYNGIVPYIHL